jgi:hypothetical protein
VISIPDPVWSGLIGALAGALVALVTTLLNNRSQSARQTKQLESDIEQRKKQLHHDEEQRNIQLLHDTEQRRVQLTHDAEQRRLGLAHDAEQRRTEREMSLRREVYLASAEATGNLQEYIGNSARMDIPDFERLKIVKGATGVLNRVHIIGSNETIEAFSAIQACFARRVIRVEEKRLAVTLKGQEIARLEGQLKLLHDRQAGIAQTLQGALRETGFDSPQVNSHPLVLEFMGIGGRIEQAQADLDQEHDSIFGLQMDLVTEVRDGVLEVGERFSTAMLAVRRELALEIDTTRYEEQMTLHNSKLRDEFEKLVEKYRGEVNEAAG